MGWSLRGLLIPGCAYNRPCARAPPFPCYGQIHCQLGPIRWHGELCFSLCILYDPFIAFFFPMVHLPCTGLFPFLLLVPPLVIMLPLFSLSSSFSLSPFSIFSPTSSVSLPPSLFFSHSSSSLLSNLSCQFPQFLVPLPCLYLIFISHSICLFIYAQISFKDVS